eukprot:2710232-Amphidinium_carterae.1
MTEQTLLSRMSDRQWEPGDGSAVSVFAGFRTTVPPQHEAPRGIKAPARKWAQLIRANGRRATATQGETIGEQRVKFAWTWWGREA